MAEIKLTIEEDSSLLFPTEKQEGQQKGQPKDGDNQQQQQMNPAADSSSPSAKCFGQQIAKLNIGRFKLFTWLALLAAFISLSKGEQKKWEWSAEAAARHNPYAYRVTGNTVWKHMLNMYFTLLVISTGSLVFHWIQRRMTKSLVTLALTDICLSLFSTVVLSIQCWQIMVGHVSIYWSSRFSFPLRLNFVIWCTSALAILLNTICLYRTVGAMKQTKLWVTTSSNYAKAHPGCSPLDTAYARFWPIGLQKLAQMLIGAFAFMLLLLDAVGPSALDEFKLVFGVCTLVWLFQWAFHTTRTRCFAANTSDNNGEQSPGLALACFVDCLFSGLGLLFHMTIYYDFSSPHIEEGTFLTLLSLICGSMFAATICFNLLLLFHHRNAIDANIAAVWGKLIKHLWKYVPRSVPQPIRISVSISFTVVKKGEEEEENAKKMNNDDNKDVEAAAIADEDEKKVEEDGKMKEGEDGKKVEGEDDDGKMNEEKDAKKVVEEKADEDGISFEAIEVGQEEEETAYCIV